MTTDPTADALTLREAVPADAGALAAIYNHGIAGRQATFETEPRTEAQLLGALVDAAAARGFWKLVSRVFPENAASRALCRRCGFREVGVYEKHGRLDGQWRDVVIVERLIPENL